MTRAHWWLVDRLSRTLESDERDAVCGDLVESDISGGQALRDLLGLVARRQAALWNSRRPWLALIAIAVPLATVLSLGARMTADGSAIPIWMYVNNWTMALESPGARQDLFDNGASIFNRYLILAICSWACGFILGFVSRRTIPVNGPLFCLVVLFTGLLPAFLPGRYHYSNAAVFSGTFYSAIFPLLVQTALVLLPAVWGMCQGLQIAKLPRALRTILWASAVTTIATLVMRNWVWVLCSFSGQQACMEWVLWAGYARIAGVEQSQQIPTLPLALVGPVGYVVAMAVWRRRRGKTAPA